MSDRRTKATPDGEDLERLAAELEGEDTRPGREDSEERRQERRRRLRDSVREMVAVGAARPQATPLDRIEALEARTLAVETDQTRLSQRLIAVEQREKATAREIAELRRIVLSGGAHDD